MRGSGVLFGRSFEFNLGASRECQLIQMSLRAAFSSSTRLLCPFVLTNKCVFECLGAANKSYWSIPDHPRAKIGPAFRSKARGDFIQGSNPLVAFSVFKRTTVAKAILFRIPFGSRVQTYCDATSSSTPLRFSKS